MHELSGTDFVAKVFDEKNRSQKRKKCERLVAMNVSATIQSAVTWPRDLLFTKDQRFAGYLMRRAEGVPLVNAVRNAEWAHRLPLAAELANVMATLHRHALIVGDASSNNVFVGKDSVTLIDVDSFHVPGFPSEVAGTLRYLRPEVLRGEVPNQPCLESDSYVLAFLLFEILHRGLSPYAHKGGSDPESNTKKQFFALAEKQSLVPKGNFIALWKRQRRELRELFERAFLKTNEPRPTPIEWALVLKAAEARPVRPRFASFFRRNAS